MFSHAAQLAGNAPDQSGVMSIGRVVRRLGAEEVHVEIEIDRKTGNAQVLKARAKETDRRHVALTGMLGDRLPDDAIGGNHLHYVQALDCSCYQCGPAAAGLWIDVPGNVRICGAKRNNRFEQKVLSTLREIAPFLGQMRVYLGLDVMLERKPQIARKDIGFSVIVVGSAVQFGHGRTHAPLHPDISSNLRWFLADIFPQGGSQVEMVSGPFQNSWNQLIGHNYIKVILLDRCTPTLSGNAGNHQ